MNKPIDSGEIRVWWDGVMDYVPLASTASNICDIYQKCVYFEMDPDDVNIPNHEYIHHIQEKSWIKIIGCLIPGLNILCALVFDKIIGSKHPAKPVKAEFSVKTRQSMQALEDEDARFTSRTLPKDINLETAQLSKGSTLTLLKVVTNKGTFEINIPTDFSFKLLMNPEYQKDPSKFYKLVKDPSTGEIKLELKGETK